MENKKTLEINAEMERILTDLCDAALKKDGMRMFGTVNQLVAAIQAKGEE